MRGQTQSQSVLEPTSYHQSPKQPLPKTKTILKHKDNPSQAQHLQNNNNKLSKQEKAKIQKQKNRQAAQRSRDMHREYVTNLEQQVKILRQKVEHSKRYCYRCQQFLGVEQTTTQTYDQLLCLDEERPLTLSEPIVETDQIEPQPQSDSFLRWLQPQEEHSFVKMMLLVCMIVIAVMIVANNDHSSAAPRTLMQKYEQSPIIYQSEVGAISPAESCLEQKGLVELHKGIENPQCLDSLMRLEAPSARKSLRSLHDNSYSPQMDNIMLCSLRTPQTYGSKPAFNDSPAVKLFVSGSDIKRMGQSSKTILSLADRNIQLNGIYRVYAEVKSVELMSHHSCLI